MQFNIYQILLFIILVSTAIDIYAILFLYRQKISNKISLPTNHSLLSTYYSLLIVYLTITVLYTIFAFIYPFIGGLPNLSGDKMRTYFTLFGFLFLLHLPKFIYEFFWLIGRIFSTLNLRLRFAGLLVSSSLLLLILYGIIWGKTDYKVKHVTLNYDNLPAEFNGFKIVQISDIHLGSFYDKSIVNKAIDLINKQNADLVVFTGDLINIVSYEALDYVDMFREIKSPYGKYSILGNHDMNDYRKIDNVKGDDKNTENVILLSKAMGFHVLLNEHSFIKRNKDSIALIGVENWGKPPFKKYGDLSKAMKMLPGSIFKILLTHDPSHWDGEVLPKTNIDLTLSGHTHGFQMGIVRHSPVNYLHSHWLGLYKNKKRYLYINAGLGFVGIPARVGISPEITVIELRGKD